MLRASSISLLIATGFTFSVLLKPANAEPQKPIQIVQKADKKGDAKKDAPSKSAKESSKEAKGKDSKDSGKDKSKDTSKDSKDDKDGKTAGDGKPDSKADAKDETPEKEPVITNVTNVSPDELIEKPKEYLGKNVRFTADFSGFCTLALNYKPALRPQKTHISFLVRKADSKIPLSEIKLALPIPKETDKVKNKMLTSLKDGDKIEVTGKVFSTAMDDPWVDVLALKRLEEAKKTDGEESSEEESEQ